MQNAETNLPHRSQHPVNGTESGSSTLCPINTPSIQAHHQKHRLTIFAHAASSVVLPLPASPTYTIGFTDVVAVGVTYDLIASICTQKG